VALIMLFVIKKLSGREVAPEDREGVNGRANVQGSAFRCGYTAAFLAVFFKRYAGDVLL